MDSPPSTSPRHVSSALVGALLGGFLGIIAGFVFAQILLVPPKDEVNNLTFGLLGMARSVLTLVTVMFAAVIGTGLGAAIGGMTAGRRNKTPLNTFDSQSPPDTGITFVNDKETKP